MHPDSACFSNIEHNTSPPLPGSDVVEWLFHHIEGFHDRREARKYASNLLKAGFIRHTVNKITFSEQCYYVFGDLSDCENCEYLQNKRHHFFFVDER